MPFRTVAGQLAVFLIVWSEPTERSGRTEPGPFVTEPEKIPTAKLLDFRNFWNLRAITTQMVIASKPVMVFCYADCFNLLKLQNGGHCYGWQRLSSAALPAVCHQRQKHHA